MTPSTNNQKIFTVLHLSAVKNWGGGGNHIENLCYELSKTNPEITNIIMVAHGGQFHERLKSSDFEFTTLPLAMNIDPRAVLKIITFCRKKKVDLIHIHGTTSLTLAVIANNFSSLPPFVFSKKTSFPIKNRKQTLYKYNHPKIQKILCVSKAVKRVAMEAITDHKKLKTVYHGTRTDNKSSKTPFAIREKFQLSSDTKIIGTIGNHIKAKDLVTWINTIDYIVNKLKISNLIFIQIGTFSELTSEFRRRIITHSLQEHIHFLGYIPNASNFIPQFDVFLLTSKKEGLPQVIYEAFYHKTPVVSTDTGGISEILHHKKNGLLSDTGDYRSLAQNVLEIIDNPHLSESFVAESYQRLFPKFTSENMAKETLEIYKEIVPKFKINGNSQFLETNTFLSEKVPE